jgi:hypothetical protein
MRACYPESATGGADRAIVARVGWIEYGGYEYGLTSKLAYSYTTEIGRSW